MKLRSLLSTSTALAATVCLVSGAVHARFNEAATSQPPASITVESLATTDRLIVKYRTGSGSGAAPAPRSRIAAEVAGNRQGVRVSALRRLHNGAQVMQLSRRMNRGEIDTLMQSLRGGDSDIEYVEPDRILQPMYVPNDTLYPQQWSLSDATGGIRAPAAWDRATGTGVTIAVIDTGVRRHVDLIANLLSGYDFVTSPTIGADGGGRDADASDPGDAAPAGACGAGSPASSSSWHGTHVAGLAAAAGGNGVGLTGVAFGARILPLRALGRCGGYTSDVADAVVWAAGGAVNGLPLNNNPAKVINLSLGGGGACDLTSQNAINTARARGATVIVAAGNENANATGVSPANCTGVVAVAATGKSGGKASYSNFGSNVAVAAPGGDHGAGLVSTLNAGSTTPGADSYASYIGTSMATPVVSGVAALMLSANPNLTPDQIASMLKASARAFPAACSGCGTGIVDAHAAVSLALAAAGVPAPAPAPVPPPTPAPAPAPAPALSSVTELEPNNSVSAAQPIASLPALVSGAINRSTDTDYFKFSVPAGKKLTITLPSGTRSGFGIAIYTAAGKQMLSVRGAIGKQQQVLITNSGATAVQLVVRVTLSTGAYASYKLSLTP